MSTFTKFLNLVLDPQNIISDEEYTILQGTVQSAIIEHLKSYTISGKERETPHADDKILKICGRAAAILEPSKTLFDNLYVSSNVSVPYEKETKGSVNSHNMWSFSRNMLKNVPLILSSKDACVMQVLPFLLFCYTMTAYKNRIDPFGESNNSRGVSWDLLIYPELQSDEDLKARAIRRRQLSSYFFPNRTAELERKNGEVIFVLDTEDYWRQGKDTKYDIDFNSIQRDGRIWIRDVELCRRFAAFLLACRNYKDVNFTLSFALFSSIFHSEVNKADGGIVQKTQGDPKRAEIIKLVKRNSDSKDEIDIYQYAGLCKWQLNYILENRDGSRIDAMLVDTYMHLNNEETAE